MERKYNIKDIQDKFNRVVAYSQNFSSPHTDKLFSSWEEAKARFIEYFDGNLIYETETEVNFPLTEDYMYSQRSRWIDQIISSGVISSRLDVSFLNYMKSINIQDFFNNSSTEEFCQEEMDGWFGHIDAFTISKGAKISKALKNFISDKEQLDHWQSRLSELIQENKVSGKLCFSVHPLDYLSISENTYKWRSCHALDGEYRAGNLNYMLDSSTVICYLKGKDNAELPNFPSSVLWNSKKWRMLLFFDDHMEGVFAGRPYPFVCNEGLNIVTKEMCEIFQLHYGWTTKWNEEYVQQFSSFGRDYALAEPHIYHNGYLKPLSRYIKDGANTHHYNDLLHSSCYIPKRIFKHAGLKDIPVTQRYKFHIGVAAPCCKCGETEIKISDSFMCMNCELEYGTSDNEAFFNCSCCGNRGLREDGYFISRAEEVVCQTCYDLYVMSCANCGETDYKSNMHTTEDGDMVCDDCYFN